MQTQTIYIKGMVCERCIVSVKEIMNHKGIEVSSVGLGEVVLRSPSPVDTHWVDESLKPLGFQIIQDKKLRLVRDTKALVAEVYSGEFDFPAGFRFSQYASSKLEVPYETISTAFAAIEQSTLEKYIINFRIEKIKELLVYSHQSLTDISFYLGFSSVAHLSKQFKDQTGLTPSHFKHLRLNRNEKAA